MSAQPDGFSPSKQVLRRVQSSWDKSVEKKKSREEVKRAFRRAAERATILYKYQLLYRYDTINKEQTRLLFISPAPRLNDKIVVRIEVFSDEDLEGINPRQRYEALSYHWGPGPADKPVYLDEGAAKILPPRDAIDFRRDFLQLKRHAPEFFTGETRKRFFVRPNLDKALRYLRHKTDPVVLWVDAVCINQSDEKVEKPEQIAKMKNIYRRAQNVCIWLGDGNTDEGDRSEDFGSEEDCWAKSWSDLLDLMKCQWFSRRWVVQELAMAQEATIHIGNHEASWHDFADAVSLFALNFDKIRALFRHSKDDRIFDNWKAFSSLNSLAAQTMVDAITNVFRRNAKGGFSEPVFNLETLVSDLAPFESSDPRDTIYALLNISTESTRRDKSNEDNIAPPILDYGKDLLQVYTDFLQWVVHSSQSLDIICRQWAQPERKDAGGWRNRTRQVELPSWIQTVSNADRVNADSLVGKPGRARYNASYGKTPQVQFGTRQNKPIRVNSLPMRLDNQIQNIMNSVPPILQPHIGPRVLQAVGMEVDTIIWKSNPVRAGVITSECLKRGGWNYTGYHETFQVPDKLWRTLVADRTAEGDNPPPWYHRVALACMTLTDNDGHLRTTELLNQEDDKSPQVIAEYLKRVQAVTRNRKFIESGASRDASGRLFGLGPPETRVGDRICILYGCSVPVILRPEEIEHHVPCFRFIGEAYVYGRMDGEVLTMSKRNNTESKTFVIV